VPLVHHLRLTDAARLLLDRCERVREPEVRLAVPAKVGQTGVGEGQPPAPEHGLVRLVVQKLGLGRGRVVPHEPAVRHLDDVLLRQHAEDERHALTVDRAAVAA
jgi:hypothetical protein